MEFKTSYLWVKQCEKDSNPNNRFGVWTYKGLNPVIVGGVWTYKGLIPVSIAGVWTYEGFELQYSVLKFYN